MTTLNNILSQNTTMLWTAADELLKESVMVKKLKEKLPLIKDKKEKCFQLKLIKSREKLLREPRNRLLVQTAIGIPPRLRHPELSLELHAEVRNVAGITNKKKWLQYAYKNQSTVKELRKAIRKANAIFIPLNKKLNEFDPLRHYQGLERALNKIKEPTPKQREWLTASIMELQKVWN